MGDVPRSLYVRGSSCFRPYIYFAEIYRSKNFRLQIPHRIAPCIQDISLDIHPESNEKINDHRRPHRQEGDVNKIFTDSTGGDAHFFANGGANTEYMPFYKLFEAVHNANVNKFSENYRLFLST